MEKIAARVVAVALVPSVAAAVAVAVAVGVQTIVLVVALASVIVAVQTTVAILGVIAKTTTVVVILATTLAMRIITMFPTPTMYGHRVLILTVCILSPRHLVNPRLVKRCQGVTGYQEWSHFPVISLHFSMSQHRFTWTQIGGIQMHLRASSRHFSSAV